MFETAWAFITTQLVSNQIFSGAALAGILLGALNYWKGVPGKIWDFVAGKLITTISIDNSDPAYGYFLQWLTNQQFDGFSKTYRIVSDFKQDSRNSDEAAEPSPRDNKNYPTLKFYLSPMEGTYLFRINGKFVKLSLEKENPEKAASWNGKPLVYEKIRLQFLGRNKKAIHAFLAEIAKLYEVHRERQLRIYFPGSNGEWWREVSKFKRRSLGSLITDQNMIYDIVGDSKNFLEQETWYHEMGIPYKRGYLFTGGPGTGKTSSIKILASQLDSDLYVINLSQRIADNEFIGLINDVPAGSIFVIEDFDRLMKLENERWVIDKDLTSTTMAGVLNGIDGVCAKDGTILVITCNDKSKLDPAIFRPGRIDREFIFKNCTQEMVRRIYCKILPNKSFADASSFAGQFKDGEKSPADIQNMLLQGENPE